MKKNSNIKKLKVSASIEVLEIKKGALKSKIDLCQYYSESEKQQLQDEITQHTVAIQYLKDNEI
jgi:hypothetical protein